MRKATKLSLKMLLIALGHIGILFISYGRKWIRLLPPMAGLSTWVWLVLPSAIAFVLYCFFLGRAGVLSEHNRRAKITICSLAATLCSLYLGVFFSLNTYGE